MAKFVTNDLNVKIKGMDISDHVTDVEIRAGVGEVTKIVLTIQADDDFITLNDRFLYPVIGNYDGGPQ